MEREIQYLQGKRGFDCEMSRAAEENSRIIEISCASDKPVTRWFGQEKFSMKPESIRLGRLLNGAPLLWNHNTDEIIGVVERVWLDGNKLRAAVRFSMNEDGEEKFRDVTDGIIRNVSIGYMVHEMVLEGRSDESGDTYQVVDWEPYEISLVSVPADETVGVGRSLEQPKAPEQKIEIKEQQNLTPRSNMTPEDRTKQNAEIEALGKRHNVPFQFAIDGELTVEQFRGFVLEQIGNSKPLQTDQRNILTPKEASKYSLARAVNSLINNEGCFERDVHLELVKRGGSKASGLLIPFEVMMGKRAAYTAGGSTGSGSDLVGTQHLADQFIDVLRNYTVSDKLGVQILTGLRENIQIPKLATGNTVAWGTETHSAAEGGATTGQIDLTPKRASAYVDYSRQLLIQSNPFVDSIMQNDLIKQCAVALDKALLQGTGTNQPTGIINNTDANSVTGTGFGYASALEFIQKVLEGNAGDGTMNWVTTPLIWYYLKQVALATNYPAFLIDANNMMQGYKVHVTNNLSHETKTNLILGDFSYAMIGVWGDAVDLVVDDKTLARSGQVRVVVNMFADVALRQPKAFSYSSNVSIA